MIDIFHKPINSCCYIGHTIYRFLPFLLFHRYRNKLAQCTRDVYWPVYIHTVYISYTDWLWPLLLYSNPPPTTIYTMQRLDIVRSQLSSCRISDVCVPITATATIRHWEKCCCSLEILQNRSRRDKVQAICRQICIFLLFITTRTMMSSKLKLSDDGVI